MTDATTSAVPPQPSLQDHINAQKQAIVAKAQEMVNTSQNIIDSWAQNFIMSEKVKSRRTDQVNFLLQFLNQLAHEGLPQINAIGNDIKDPDISNKVLECNNMLMTAARNVLTNIQQQESTFQTELQAEIAPKTEVKTQEA